VLYRKPELTDLGDTNQLIRSTDCPHRKIDCFGDNDGSDLTATVAYEADE
jgi:hypothetical protein